MMTEYVKIGKYRHYKGREYSVIGVGKHSETLEPMVIYNDYRKSKRETFRQPILE